MGAYRSKRPSSTRRPNLANLQILNRSPHDQPSSPVPSWAAENNEYSTKGARPTKNAGMSNDKNTLAEFVREVPAEYRGQLRAYIESSPAAQPAKAAQQAPIPGSRAYRLADRYRLSICNTRSRAGESTANEIACPPSSNHQSPPTNRPGASTPFGSHTALTFFTTSKSSPTGPQTSRLDLSSAGQRSTTKTPPRL